MSTFKIPKTIGACADRIYALRKLAADAQKKVDLLKEEEKAIREHVINKLPKSEASGVAGKSARVTVVEREVPCVEDWDAFWKSFRKSRDRDLLQRRLSDAAITERWEAGKQVPGVGKFKYKTLSVNKV